MAEEINLEETLERLILDGPVDDLRAFLTTTVALDNRAKLCSLARKWHKKADTHSIVGEGLEKKWVAEYPTHVSTHAFEALVLTSEAGDFKNIKWNDADSWRLGIELAKLLKTDCLSACVESLLIQNPRIYRNVRPIISAGLCPKPGLEQYAIGVIASNGFHLHRDYVLDFLRSDLNILEEDIWLLFETEGTAEFSLAAIDNSSSPGSEWSDILYILQKDGTLSRERMLKASLEALNRGFPQYRAGWFSRFHESLNPTDAERAALLEDYGKLLSSNIPPTVSFALSAWRAIDNAQPIQSDIVARYLSPCFSAQTKSTAVGALSLIEKVCKRDPTFRKHGLSMALQALSHETVAVQERLLKLLNAHKEIIDEDLLSLIEQQLPMVAPSLQHAFRVFTGTSEEVQSDAGEVYAIADGACELFYRGAPLTVIQKPEDFIEMALTLLEAPFNPATTEILLAAVALGKVEALRNIGRSKDNSLLLKLSRPLLARIKKIEKQRAETNYRDAGYFFLLFMLHFLGAESVPENFLSKPHEYFQASAGEVFGPSSVGWAIKHFAHRLIGILERTVNGAFTHISLPTWDSGYVSTADFLQQCEFASSSNCFYLLSEPYLSIMRLPWPEHEYVFAELTNRNYGGAYVEQIREILWRFIEARRKFAASDPYDRDLLVIKALIDGDDYNLGTILQLPGITTHDGTLLVLSFYNYPILTEVFHAEGAKECKRLVRGSDVSDLSRLAYFFPMAYGIAPLKGRAHFLLAVGCLLSIPEIVAFVCDCLVVSIESRNLNPEKIGEKLGLLLHSEISMPKRVATTLAKVAAVSDLHTDAVRQVLELSLARRPEDSEIGTPRDLGALLEVLLTCSWKARQPIKNQSTRTYLESLKPGGKTGKLAKELLALR